MTDDLDPDLGPDLEPMAALDDLEPADLDGYTIEALSDYLDAGRMPRDPGIESSPGCRIALDALQRLRNDTWAMLELDAGANPARDDSWITTVMKNISREARAGRDIPIHHPDPVVRLRLTEGSVRGLIRAAGDATGGALIGRVDLQGDVTVPGEPITVAITASATWGRNLAAISEEIRATVVHELAAHTELNVIAVDVAIQDIHLPRTDPHEDAP